MGGRDAGQAQPAKVLVATGVFIQLTGSADNVLTYENLKYHLGKALDNRLTPEEIEELSKIAFYSIKHQEMYGADVTWGLDQKESSRDELEEDLGMQFSTTLEKMD